MAVQMTRKEYEAKYGVAPVISAQSTLDTTPAPIRMTQAEYDTIYNPKAKTGAQKVKEQVGESFNAGIDKSTAGFEKVVDTVKNIKNINNVSDVKKSAKDLLRGELRFLSGGVEAAYAPLAPAFAPVGKGINKVADKVSNIKAVQKFASGNKGEERIQKAEDVLDLINIGSVVPVGKAGSAVASSTRKAVTKIPKTIDTIQAKRVVTAQNNIAKELYNIENNYAKLRKSNDFSKDAGTASRQRIADAQLNQGILSGAVDTDGTIRTKQPGGAIDKYKALTIDGKEAVVRENLARLGETTNIKQVENALKMEVGSSGLEGADLIAALNGIQKELQGLKLKADEFGNIPNEVIHDAKINTTKNINYQTPPETATYRKAVARAHKKLVEENSSFNVEEVNKELGKYLEDIKRLEALDGRKVKGGKLGKYFAQVSGNIIGGAAGGAIGGPAGIAVGTIAGGEAAGFLKGKTMARTFGGGKGLPIKSNPILDTAKVTAKLPVMKLKTPDLKVGAPKNITKTKEIFKLENDIAKNVEAQKKAIKAGDFTVVQALKDVYKALIDNLKAVIKRIKETPNKQGGFIKIGKDNYSKSLGNRNTQYNNTKTINTKAIPKASTTSPIKSNPKGKGTIPENTLISEAKKYKSAEEFVKAQGTPIYHGSNENIKVFSPKKGAQGVIWFTDNPKAITAGESGAQGTKFINERVTTGKKFAGWDEYEKLGLGQIKQMGFDGIKLPSTLSDGTKYNDYVLFDNKTIKSKSQLTDIWKKANK